MVRRNVLRVYHIQRTEFLPSAELFVRTIVFLILGVLIFTRMDSVYESLVLVALIAYFFIYLLGLLKILDKPFRVDDHTRTT